MTLSGKSNHKHSEYSSKLQPANIRNMRSQVTEHGSEATFLCLRVYFLTIIKDVVSPVVCISFVCTVRRCVSCSWPAKPLQCLDFTCGKKFLSVCQMETVETIVAESKDKSDKQYCSVKEGKRLLFCLTFQHLADGCHSHPAPILSPIMQN